jgi:hypothetical protein
MTLCNMRGVHTLSLPREVRAEARFDRERCQPFSGPGTLARIQARGHCRGVCSALATDAGHA